MKQRLLVLFFGLTFLPGCCGFTQNPSYFPYLWPTGDIKRTHAKPPGRGYFADFDPHAIRLEVRPIEVTLPVRSQQVILATIYDEKDKPRRRRRIEWMAEGVGNIVEVDESGYMPGRGYKVDNRYAVSYTDYFSHRFTRGNKDPNDDFMVRPGQTWCAITSAVEGDTHVTVYAPEINNWDANKYVVTTHWVDAEWSLPQPASARSGSEVTLTTTVFRHTDRQPLENYRVRYHFLDGPPAVFLPNRGQEAVATSDLRGHAVVSLAQIAPQLGVSRIGIEIIRPPDPTSPSGVGIVIGHGETTVAWQAPQVTLSNTGPAAVAVGQEAAYTITVTNSGQVESQAMTVRNPIPEGMQFVRSDPPAIVEGNQLIWTLGALQPNQAHTIQVVLRSTRLGAVNNCASVVTLEGLRDEKCMVTQVTAPQLTVAVNGPVGGMVNTPIPFPIAISNPGTGPAVNVLITASFDQALEHETRANPVELPIGALAAGESRTVTLVLTPRQIGRAGVRVVATADGNLRAQADHALTIQMAQLSIRKVGPAVSFKDQPAEWHLRVANGGDVPLRQIVVRDRLPPELTFGSATDGGQLISGEVVWNISELPPREERIVKITVRCARIAPRAVNVALATANPGLQSQAEAAIEIRGVPAFGLEMFDMGDPAEIGGRVSYRINVTNTGSLPANQVEIAANVPPQMRIVNVNGPGRPRVEGQRVVFPAVDSVQPQQALQYTIDVQPMQPGDVRFRVELRSETLTEPVIKEESTNIVGPLTGIPDGRPAIPETAPPPLAPPRRQEAGPP